MAANLPVIARGESRAGTKKDRVDRPSAKINGKEFLRLQGLGQLYVGISPHAWAGSCFGAFWFGFSRGQDLAYSTYNTDFIHAIRMLLYF